ncbi:hypothetical protein PHISP_02559 [Aspergillus sp. HF37]|nr:hypothetical protein PHISP_02559 [Aspergillus sp. HF37]
MANFKLIYILATAYLAYVVASGPSVVKRASVDDVCFPKNNNFWYNINTRTPSFRFGTGHVYKSYFENAGDGINTRMGAQMLVESNVFVNVDEALYSTDKGYTVARNNDWGSSKNAALEGT